MTVAAWRYIALHTAGAAVVGFVIQRFVIGASLEMSLLWGALFALAAAGLAWHQSNR